MCEKNLEGKVLSPSSKDDKDETLPKDWKPVKKSPKKKRSKRSKSKKALMKICKTCGQDILSNEKRDMFMFHDTYHQLRTKEYCKDHELVYSDHKCTPSWCGDCGYFRKYEIIVNWEKKEKHW